MSTIYSSAGYDGSELHEYVATFKHRKWHILLITVLVVGASLVKTYREQPIYRSEARVLVRSASTDPTSFVGFPNMETESQLVTSNPVATIAAEKLGVEDPRAIAGGVAAFVTAETEVLSITYTAQDPLEAKRGAQAFAEAYLQYRRNQVSEALSVATETLRQQADVLSERVTALGKELEATTDPNEQEVIRTEYNTFAGQLAIVRQQLTQLIPPERLLVGTIVETAQTPSRPSNQNYTQAAIIGLFFGLLVSTAYAVLRERLDDRVRDRQDVEHRLGAPVLAVIPHISRWRREKEAVLISDEEPWSPGAEAYRTLRTGVLFAAARQSAKTLLITSPHAGEGKTATAANLGLVLAQAGRRVILISADLRRPRLHNFFQLPNEAGLTSVLSRRHDPLTVLTKVNQTSNLRVITSGAIPDNPAELLGSEEMGELLLGLRSTADFVIIDAPPVLGVADASILAAIVDGVLFVADVAKSTRQSIAHAEQQLRHVNARILGGVLNDFDPSEGAAYSNYYRHTGPDPSVKTRIEDVS